MFLPNANLPVASMPWGRAVVAGLEELAQAVRLSGQEGSNSFKMVNSTVNRVQQQVTELELASSTLSTQASQLSTQAAQISTQAGQMSAMTTNLTNVTNYLSSLGVIRSAEAGQTTLPNNAWFAGTGGNRPSVTINSPTGRVELYIAHTVQTGNELRTTYTATGGLSQDRTSNLNSNTRMLSTAGNASSPASASVSLVLNVTPNVNTNFTIEHYANAAGQVILGRIIQARVLP